MNIMEENFQNNNSNNKSSKTSTIILVLIAIVLIAIIGIVIFLSASQSSKLKISLNGKQNNNIKEALLIQDDGTIYVQIRKIAEYLGYSSYQGDYIEKSEERNKCYIQNDDEIAGFELHSNKIYKLNLSEKDSNYENYYIKQPVIAKEGVLYATSEGIEKAFNASFTFDKEKNTIKIYTMPYLVELYSSKVMDYGYKKMNDAFTNKKSLLENMIVVEKDDKTMGVITTEGKEVLGAKYNKITYLPSIGDFLVQSNGKYGVLSDTGSTKIKIRYDSIQLMDSDTGLYLVSIENKYGILDLRGNLIIDINNDEIGMDVSKFERNEITNKYILASNLIPVRQNKLWGIYDTKGNKVVDFKYDSLGYVSADKSVYSLLVIQNYNVLVACKDKKYTLLKPTGEELFAPIADDIYMTIEGNKKKYTIFANNRNIDAEEFLKSQGITEQKQNKNATEDEEENAEQDDKQNKSNNTVENKNSNSTTDNITTNQSNKENKTTNNTSQQNEQINNNQQEDTAETNEQSQDEN